MNLYYIERQYIGEVMVEKIQYEDDKLKICAPDSLKFIVDDIVNYFYKQCEKVFNFYHLKSYGKYQINLFDEEIKNARYVGEIGLDKGKNIHDYEKQQELFEHIINECEKTGEKIISIHSRNSVTDILKIIKKDFNCKVIMHWFSGNIDELNLCIKRDFYFSINPKMLNTKKGRMIIEKIPINRILIESDAPLATESNVYDFLFMKELIEYIAKIKRIDCNKVNNIFRNNFKNLLS